MKKKELTYFIIGVVFIVLGIIMIVKDGSRTMAYGDIVIGICMLIFSRREKGKDKDGGDK